MLIVTGCLQAALAKRVWEHASYGGRLTNDAELQLEVGRDTSCMASVIVESDMWLSKVVLRWPTRQPHYKLLTFSGYFGTISLVDFQWLVVDPFLDLAAQEKSRDETCHVRFGDTFHTVSQILVYLGNEGEFCVARADVTLVRVPDGISGTLSQSLWMPSNLKAFGLHMVGLGSAFGASCDSVDAILWASHQWKHRHREVSDQRSEWINGFLLQDGLKSV